MIYAYLLHLSYNMWGDREAPELGGRLPYYAAKPYMRCDTVLWREITAEAAQQGINAIVIDLGDAVRYESRPEIAVEGAWSVRQLKSELDRMRELGLEVIPKLNFAATHDTWFGPYARCLSTPAYYDACSDLIEEVIGIFDTPRLFHLGMDEEDFPNQAHHEYVVIRQHDLWWHDLDFLAGCVERGGSRPWVWSDYLWTHAEEFPRRMPRSILQSNWYYGGTFGNDEVAVKAYSVLEQYGFDQLPAGSTWTTSDNFAKTVAYCREHIPDERLMGFMQTVWHPTIQECRDVHMEALRQVGLALRESS